ncbi:secretin N-terminal domain-containing protein [Methylobacterium hispanicum]|jgi:general secretion pathway protein D|uniref:Secretin XpsD n=2 Tax=Methylobacterium TaxID=407 RepID=A0AAV4ZU86_9HYPH|nr:secretin N-terminal domain-containing protein [Methylobacterium hispanicum]GJD91469.1 Secretin XpsD [Methylobacterium hispanicum]
MFRTAHTLVFLAPLLLPVAGCVSIAGDACTDPDTTAGIAVVNDKDVTPRNCDGRFLSARNQRSVLYTGEDRPRLWTGEGTREAQDIDVRRVNAPPLGYNRAGTVTGYLGTLKLNYAAADEAVEGDVAALQNSLGRRFDPDQKVSVDFRKATLDYVLKQMLGGALGLSYIAPEDLGGSVTFRTEEPVPKAQVLQVVRDILARNGLEMRSINGVFHIGKPELIGSIEATGQAGRVGERTTRILRLRKGAGGDLLALARQIVPPSIELVQTNNPDTILVRATAAEIDQAEKLIKGLVQTGLTEDRVAVIPLRQSAPEKIAGQLTEFFRSRNSDPVSIVPLDGQQALLVSSKAPGMIDGVRRLAEAMDTEVRDEVSLRVIPLQHLVADEIAQRLAVIFGSGQAGGGGRAGTLAGGPGGPGGLGGRGGEAVRDPAPIPRLSPASVEDGALPYPYANGPGNGLPRGGPPAEAASGGGLGAGQQGTRIVADKTSNALLVYSNYSLFKKVREVLRALDVPPAQVVIEATVVEVELTDQLQTGVQVFLQGAGFVVGSGNIADIGLDGRTAATGSNTGGGTSGVGSTGSVGGGGSNGFGGVAAIGARIGNALRVDAVLRALQGVTKVKVISSPYLTVLNGKQARLVIGDQIPYAQRSQSANNLGNTTVTQEIVIKDTGIILDITPQIHVNNSVALKVNQSVSTPSQSVLAGNLTPVISTRSVESDILLQSGRTVLLAGLIQDRLEQQEDGVPVLKTVPVVGDFFKQKVDNVRRVELILLLTPRVTRNASQIEDLARLLQEQVHTR